MKPANLQRRLPGGTLFAFLFPLFVSVLSCSRPRPLIYVIPRTTATLFWESVHSGALDAAQANHLRVHWNAATREDDVDRQIALVQQVSKRDCAGIVLAPDHAAALLTAVRALANSGVPVVVIESRLPLDPGPNLTYIVSDHARAGHEAARYVAQIAPAAHVAVLGLNPDIAGNMERARSFAEGLATSAPLARISEKEFSRFNRQEAEGQMEKIIDNDPSVDVVFALSSQALFGALDAVQRRKPAHRIHLIGCDQDMDLMEPLRSGEIDALILQDTYRQGYLAVQALAEHRRSGHWPAQVVTKVRLITRNDLDDPQVQRSLTMSPER